MLKNIKILLNNQKIIFIGFWSYFILLNYLLFKTSNPNALKVFTIANIDKIAHFSFFFVLCCLSNFTFPKANKKKLLLILIFYAGLTELIQGFMDIGRSCELLDFIADIFGIFSGFIFLYKLIKITKLTNF